MSYRRSISFSEDERDLLEYFDTHGRSDFAKKAMLFFIENKDNVITDGMLKILKTIGINNNQSNTPQRQISHDTINKLRK